MLNRDEKIENEIIKPKDELIQKLHQENVSLHKELSKQANIIDKAEKFETERKQDVDKFEIVKEDDQEYEIY